MAHCEVTRKVFVGIYVFTLIAPISIVPISTYSDLNHGYINLNSTPEGCIPDPGLKEFGICLCCACVIEVEVEV